MGAGRGSDGSPVDVAREPVAVLDGLQGEAHGAGLAMAEC